MITAHGLRLSAPTDQASNAPVDHNKSNARMSADD
jgi:hypothetical protein